VPPTVQNVIQFPYKRSLGPVLGAFMTGLADCRILGIRRGKGVLVPPLEWDPETAEALEANFVEVGPAGTVVLWTWVSDPSVQHPLSQPFAFALIRLDGADTPLFHAVDCGAIEAIAVGARVAPRWRSTRVGSITDIECFVLGEQPIVPAGAAIERAEPVTMMDYQASITYTDSVSAAAERVTATTSQGRLVGQRCPTCARVYNGGRGYCPVDAVELTEADEVELPQRGAVTTYTIVTPVQYPGQTETEAFARVMVLLDGTDVVLTYQALVDTPVSEVRTGLRVGAVWASPALAAPASGGGMGAMGGYLVGWMPTGEPDAADPDLVNRVF
jgi:uncharacterized OB-fold protein